jgi:hypothetical protein
MFNTYFNGYLKELLKRGVIWNHSKTALNCF